jgi:SSS family solute:Na+ symporter
MSDRQVELWVFVALLGVVLGLAFYAARWRRPATFHTLEEWGVGGRAFGNWVTWFLIGGSSYTAYTFVAVPSLVYGAGAIGFFALPFALITAPLMFLVSPRGWSVSHAHGFVTSAEFARARFGSRTVGAIVAVTGILATMPYIAVQLIALQGVFKVIGIAGEWPLLVALGLVSFTTFRSGLRAPALLSIAKDVLLVWIVISVILVVAMSGGWGSAFRAADARFTADASPVSGLTLHPAGYLSYLTLAIGSALSIFAYPHALTAVLAARDRATVKRNAGALPVYTAALGLMGMLGIFAIAEGVIPVGGDLNTVTPQVFHELFPAWSAGIAYATLAVSALIPAAVMSISAANLFTRSLWVDFFRPRASAREEARVAQWASLVVKLGAVGVIVLLDPTFSVEFQLIGGVIILQTLPAVFLGLMTGWFHRWALVAGTVVGLAVGLVMLYQIPQLSLTGSVIKPHFGGSTYPLAFLGIPSRAGVYVGLVALLVNLVVVVVGTVVLRLLRAPANVDVTSPGDYHADADDPSLDRLDFLLDGGERKTGAHALR